MGKYTLDIHHNNTIHSVPFIIANTTSLPLLGLQTCVDLNLIKHIWAMNANVPDIIQGYKDVLASWDAWKRIITLTLIVPPRKIPILQMEKLKAELERMCKLDVIKKIKTAPLRKLLDKDVDWHFDESHHNTIQRLKHLIMSGAILTYYDPTHALRITADPLKSDLGTVLEQCHEDTW